MVYPNQFQITGHEFSPLSSHPSTPHAQAVLLPMYRVEQRKIAKFGEGSSIRADWLCIGCPKLVGIRKEGNSNRGLFFCSSLYVVSSLFYTWAKACMMTEGWLMHFDWLIESLNSKYDGSYGDALCTLEIDLHLTCLSPEASMSKWWNISWNLVLCCDCIGSGQ